jgi:hypothetical protein
MIDESKDADVKGTDKCEKYSTMENVCICCECTIRDTCCIETLCKTAGCNTHFVTKCLTKEKLEGKNVLEEGQEARRAAAELKRHTLSNSFLFEE